jgi:hypothetical protein
MTVDRTQLGCQTRYTLRDGAALSCTLTFGADQGAPPEWKIVLPGSGGDRQLDAVHLFAAPVAVRLRAWLAAIIGPDRAAELDRAVGARPPRLPGVPRHASTAPGLHIPRQRDHRA